MCISLNAHNAKISTFTLRDTGAGWMVEMAFAQASIDVAMQNIFDEYQLKNFTSEEYRNEVIDYVKEHFHLKANGINIELDDGGIMLGNHQANLKFVLPQIPINPDKMKVYIPMFGNMFNHTNIFRIYRGGAKVDKVFLSSDNDFRANVEFTKEGMISFNKEPIGNEFPWIKTLSFGLMLLTLMGFIGYKMVNNKMRIAQVKN